MTHGAAGPIRVGLIAYRDDPRLGGSLRVAQTLAQHLPKDQVAAQLLFAYGPPGPIASTVTIPVHCFQAPSAKHPSSWKQARAWIKAQPFDLLHFVDTVQWLYLATLGLPLKRVEHFHGRPILSAYHWRDRLAAIAHRSMSDAGIAITHGAKQGVAQAGLMSESRLHVVYNGVDLDYFSHLPNKNHARTALGLPHEAKLFGQVARLVQGNACLEILDVLKQLPDSWHAVLVGDGPLRVEIQQQANSRGLSGRVHFTGSLDDVRPAYAALDAVVLLSRYQPFCLMLAEAMACGVPVFGLQGEGEYAEPENPLITSENSSFFPRQNPHDFESMEPESSYSALAQAMQTKLKSKKQCDQMTQHAKHWVTTRFSAKSQAEVMLGVYQKVLASQ